MSLNYLSQFPDSGHNFDVMSSRFRGPLVLAQPQQTPGTGEVGGHRVPEVIQDVSQVGYVYCELLGAAGVEAWDGGDIGEVGGARRGGHAAQEEVGGGLDQ